MIQIITTGGTIEGLEYDDEKEKPENGTVNIEDFLETANVTFEFEIYNAFRKDSRFITPEDRGKLLKLIEQTNAQEILITHGTITMVETAKFLGMLNIDKTIILTGSFILGTEKNTDATFNLGYAICALQTLGKGVHIAMNGGIFSWNNVVKNVDKNRFEVNVN